METDRTDYIKETQKNRTETQKHKGKEYKNKQGTIQVAQPYKQTTSATGKGSENRTARRGKRYLGA
jgi:hypothetical protein